MNPRMFQQGLEIVVGVFGDGVIKGNRLERIKQICDEKISDEGFIKICEMFCDTFRQAPLPVDFEKAVNEWRKTYHTRNGKNFNQPAQIEEGDGIDCRKCGDLGYLKITHKNPEIKLLTLMRCHCEMGGRGSRDIPEWDNALLSVYNCEPCPISWFKPDFDLDTSNDAALLGTLFKKAMGWRDFIKKSEAYWKAVRDA